MEPSGHRDGKEKDEGDKKQWMKVSPDKVTARFPKDDTSQKKKRPILQRSTSEILISSTNYDDYQIERTTSRYTIRDPLPAEPSDESLAPSYLFLQEVEGEEPSGAVIQLTRARHLSHSYTDIYMSALDFVHPPSTSRPNPLLAHSDINPSRIFFHEGFQLFNQANHIFENYINALQLRNVFYEIERQFLSLYPNYWNHLLAKCGVYMNPEDAAAEEEAMTDVVGICTRTLQDEMAVEMRSSVRDIGLTGSNLISDFYLSIMYLKRKYPLVFAYLSRRHNFIRFTNERMRISHNWREVENLLNFDPKKLEERDRKYSRK